MRDPIATYTLSGRERPNMQLFEDSVKVLWGNKDVEFSATVPLGRLVPRAQRIEMLGQTFLAGALILCAAVVALMGFTVYVMVRDVRGPVAGPLTLLSLAGAVGLGLILRAHRRRRRLIRFRSEEGVPLLDILLDINRPENTDWFVGLVIEQVRKVRSDRQ
jgi:hypothetical protein